MTARHPALPLALAAAAAVVGACARHVVSSARGDAVERSSRRPPAVEPRPGPERDLGAAERQYLIHDDGEIVLRTLDGPAERVLASDAWNVLYHASLELVWYVHQDALHVVDLRTPEMAPIRIAHGVTAEMGGLRVEHPHGSASDNALCDVELVTLRFGKSPSFELVDESLEPPVLENADWLVAQLDRPARALPAPRGFSSEKKRRVSGRKLACHINPDECGASVSLGGRTTELIVVGNDQGDCYHRYCLLYDPVRKQYGTPPEGEPWSAPGKLEAAECEVYRFARDDLTFFTYSQLCAPATRCVDVAGAVLGWRVPGVVIGEP